MPDGVQTFDIGFSLGRYRSVWKNRQRPGKDCQADDFHGAWRAGL